MKIKRTRNEGKRAQVNREVPRSRTGYARVANDPALLAALDGVDRRWRMRKSPVIPPSFMIRGDRLLLFMDIMELLRNHLRRDGEWKERSVIGYENPRLLSLHRIVAILGERFGATEAKLYNGIEALSRTRSGWIRDFRIFLRSNMVVLGRLVLKVGVISARIAVSTKDYATYLHLLEAIAQGELTEADFKE